MRAEGGRYIGWPLALIHALNRQHAHFFQRFVSQSTSVSFHAALEHLKWQKFQICPLNY